MGFTEIYSIASTLALGVTLIGFWYSVKDRNKNENDRFTSMEMDIKHIRIALEKMDNIPARVTRTEERHIALEKQVESLQRQIDNISLSRV